MDQKNPDIATLSEADDRRSRPGARACACAVCRNASSTASCPGSISTGGSSRRPTTSNHPLLERLRFLSISANNLDEFFMVRVAGLIGQQRRGISMISDDGQSLSEQLAHIGEAVSALAQDQQAIWADLRQRARRRGDRPGRGRARSPTRSATGWRSISSNSVFPTLTPLAIDPGPPVSLHPQSRPDRRAAAEPQGRRAADDGADAHAAARSSRFVRLPATEAGHGPLHQHRTGGDAVRRAAVSGLCGRRAGRLPGHPRLRHRGRGRSRGSGPLLRERAEAPAPRFGDPAGDRRRDAGRPARRWSPRRWR